MSISLYLAERACLPDKIIRAGIRRLDKARLEQERKRAGQDLLAARQRYVDLLSKSPLALKVEKANEQHYELPPEFFTRVLGSHLKYSSCFYETGLESLSEAERRALETTVERAELADGMKILELGCGWGSLTLYMARAFRHSRITGISNSNSQREYILGRARAEGLTNVDIQTVDMNVLTEPGNFDRIVSVEMFEHMRNYKQLFARIATWLNPGGKVFAHIFCHKDHSYLFEEEGQNDWMGRYFFSGGMMPSQNLFHSFSDDLKIEAHWRWSGVHYQRTAEDWLRNLDRCRDELLPILARVYGPDQSRLWLQRWRIFFMACAELFGYACGEEWFVCHYRMIPASVVQ